jgi:hypothetical protein
VKKTRQNKKLEPPFRFNRNGKGPSRNSSMATPCRGVLNAVIAPNRIFFRAIRTFAPQPPMVLELARAQSQAATSARLATQAISRAMLSGSCIRWQNV